MFVNRDSGNVFKPYSYLNTLKIGASDHDLTKRVCRGLLLFCYSLIGSWLEIFLTLGSGQRKNQ